MIPIGSVVRRVRMPNQTHWYAGPSPRPAWYEMDYHATACDFAMTRDIEQVEEDEPTCGTCIRAGKPVAEPVG